MGKTAVIYGSTTGTCSDLAERIASKLDAETFDISSIDAATINGFDSLILGSSTWGYGELQDDWYNGINTLKSAELAGKTIALFGCGDAESYCDTFCDAIGLIYNEIKDCGAKFVGSVAKDDYSFDSSVAEVDGMLVGLALDELNDSQNTDSRIEKWVDSIKDSL